MKQLLLLLLCLFTTPSLLAADCDNPATLRFAQVPQTTPELQRTQYQSLYQQLERVTQRRLEVVQVSSYGAVVEGLLNGSVDVAELGPAAYAAARRRGAEITVFAAFQAFPGTLFDFSQGYQSVLIVRADRHIDSLAALKGASLALVDPGSTSGALYPRQAVRSITGQPLENWFRRVTFAGSHDRAIEAVRGGRVDAAFVSSTQVDRLVQEGSLRRDELAILWKSENIPLDPFVHRQRLCPPLADKIRRALLDDQKPLQALFRQLRRSGFVAVGEERYRGIRALYDAQGD